MFNYTFNNRLNSIKNGSIFHFTQQVLIYNILTMQVYAELAVIENFCMDFTLLYAAKAAVKNRAGAGRIALSASFGALFAVVFPLFEIGAALAVILKLASGMALCLIAGKKDGFKSFIKFSGAFFIFGALLAGVLLGLFNLTGWSYETGQGFLVSSVPIGVPLFLALLIVIGAKKLAVRLKKTHKEDVICRIYAGELLAEVKGFFDSGNKVYLKGSPVCVVPEEVVLQLSDRVRINERVKIHTVAGSKIMNVFTCDRLEVDFGEDKKNYKDVKIGVSPQKINTAVLHCDLLENRNV